MQDRQPGAPGQYKALLTAEEFQKMQAEKQFTITMNRDDQPIVEGTPYSKAAVLPDNIAEKICQNFVNPTPADAFYALYTGKAAATKSATGNILKVNDAIRAPLYGLTIYGKTTQNGTPTPENPAELVSAGASGTLQTAALGKNLFSIQGFEKEVTRGFEVTADPETGKVTINGSRTSSGSVLLRFRLSEFGLKPFKAGTYTISMNNDKAIGDSTQAGSVLIWANYLGGSGYTNPCYAASINSKRTINAQSDISILILRIGENINTIDNLVLYPQFEVGNAATEFEPYKDAQIIEAETPNGLSGIPVSKGGNYTDENGQQWICDYKDYFNGVYLKMVNVVDAATLPWKKSTNFFYVSLPLGGRNVLCSSYPCVGVYTDAAVPSTDKIITLYAKLNGIRINNSRYTDVSSFVASLDGVKIAYPLETPVETPLSAEEMEQYLAFHTNNPNTTIFNDSGADMKVEYHTHNAAVPMNLGSCREGHLLIVDDHGCVTTAHKASLPYAPSGYGLGHAWCKDIYSWEELDTAVNGWYYLDTDTAGTGAASGIKKGLVRVSSEAGAFGVQELYPSWSGEKLERRLNEYEWDEWEWVNPPMQLGVEYRTTERWIGKPVYVKAVDCGTLPNNDSKTVSAGVSGYFRPVEIEARRPIDGGGQVVQKLPIISGNDVLAIGFMYGSGVRIVTTSDMSAYTAIATVKYTKN